MGWAWLGMRSRVPYLFLVRAAQHHAFFANESEITADVGDGGSGKGALQYIRTHRRGGSSTEERRLFSSGPQFVVGYRTADEDEEEE